MIVSDTAVPVSRPRAVSRARGAALSAAVAAVCMLFAGCIPEESPIAPYDRGPVRSMTIELGVDYGTQVYIDLETGQVVKTNHITDYDLTFRSDTSAHHVRLNSATLSAAWDCGPVPFADVRSTAGAVWRHDRPNGDWDSTAIGTWWESSGEGTGSRNHVYVIDRGYDEAGRARGFVKMMILGADAYGYRIRTAKLDGSNDHETTVPRDRTRALTGFTFDSSRAVTIEPMIGTWDFVMTRYTHVFYDPEYIPYAVNGALLNPDRVQAAEDTVRKFDSITGADLSSFSFSSDEDVIGYDWKVFDLDKNKYFIDTRRVYIVRRRDGLAFKLRFTDFYNTAGQRGYPLMEWQKL